MTPTYLLSYNIHINDVTETDYFRTTNLHIPEHLVTFSKTSSKPSLMKKLPNPKYGCYSDVLSLLEKMHVAHKGSERTVDDFLVTYLTAHGFLSAARDCFVSHKKLCFLICGKLTAANPDWHLPDTENIIHTLGENKRVASKVIPEGQLTMEVLAADQWNRNQWVCDSEITGKCHIMTFLDLAPMFYKYSIRPDLQEAVVL